MQGSIRVEKVTAMIEARRLAGVHRETQGRIGSPLPPDRNYRAITVIGIDEGSSIVRIGNRVFNALERQGWKRVGIARNIPRRVSDIAFELERRWVQPVVLGTRKGILEAAASRDIHVVLVSKDDARKIQKTPGVEVQFMSSL